MKRGQATMGGICAIVDFGQGRIDDGTLLSILDAGTAGTFGGPGMRTWHGDGIALAGGPAAWAMPRSWSGSTSGSMSTAGFAGSGALIVLADARLDGRAELREELAAASRSSAVRIDPGIAADLERLDDPALIAAAHTVWGDGAPAHLIGDFAYLVWDAGRRRLQCVRDALGVRPLHVAWTPDSKAVVASEARMVAAHPGIPVRLDLSVATAHLSGRIPDEQRTILEGIRSIPPAHWLEIQPDASRAGRSVRYWTASTSRERWSDDPATSAERLRSALARSIADRLDRPDDAPIGILLSGGLDSSSIAALAARHARAEGGSNGIVAFTYAFDRLSQCDESRPAERLASRYGFQLVRIDVEDEWLLQNDAAFRPALDQPFTSWSSVTLRVLEALRDRGIPALLTGHGGDNMVGGSPLAYASRLLRGRFSLLGEARRDADRRGISPALLLWSSAIRPLLPDFSAHAARRLTGRGPAWRPPPWLLTGDQSLWRVEDSSRRRGITSERSERVHDPAVRAARIEALVLGSVGRAIEGYERAAAPFGIEVRHPFIDRRLVEVVLSVPPEHHYANGRTKALLRQALHDNLPSEIVDRVDKTDFGPYLDYSLREASTAKVEALFDRPVVARLGLVDSRILLEAYGAYRAGRLPFAGKALWSTITLELWLREHGRVLGLTAP